MTRIVGARLVNKLVHLYVYMKTHVLGLTGFRRRKQLRINQLRLRARAQRYQRSVRARAKHRHATIKRTTVRRLSYMYFVLCVSTWFAILYVVHST